MRTPVLVVAALGLGIVGAAAFAVADRDETSKSVIVDERGGVLHGVRFGDDEAAVRRRLGQPTDDAPGVFPEGADYTGPPFIPSPKSDQGRPPRQPITLHYDEASYLVSPTVGVFSMSTLAAGARTRAGVGVGDDLARVRERYDRVTCGESVAGEAIVGATPMYPWCRALVGEVRVFFGEDPIASITLTSYARLPTVDDAPEAARRFDRYPLYWVGPRFEGWELEHVDVREFVTLGYGTCEPPTGTDGGCAPPLQIQIQPLCAHLEAVARAQIWKRRRVRGAPVGTIDSAPVLFTNRVQVKVYRGQGSDPGLPMRALRALRSANRVPPVVDADDAIPPAPRTVLSGQRSCS